MPSMQTNRLRDVTVISDPSDIYVFEKPDNFVLREDLEK